MRSGESVEAVFQRSGQQRRRLVLVASATATAAALFLPLLIFLAMADGRTPARWALPDAGRLLDFGPVPRAGRFGGHGWRLVGWTSDSSKLLLVCSYSTGYVSQEDAFIVEVPTRSVTTFKLHSYSDAMPLEEEQRAAEFARNRQQLDRWVQNNQPLQRAACGMHGPNGRSIRMRRVSRDVAEADLPDGIPLEIRGPGRSIERAKLSVPASHYPQPSDHLVLLPCWSPDGASVVFVARPTDWTPHEMLCGSGAILLPRKP